jgi:hypothetical protein
MSKTLASVAGPTDFSLVQGGPLFQLLLRTGLLKPPTGLLARRVLVISLVAWLPLLVLSVLSGHALRGPGVPFLLDLGAHARLLVSVPLLLAAEVIAHERVRVIVRQFLDRGVVAPEDEPRFQSLIDSAMRFRNSVVAELLLLGFAIAGGYSIGQRYLELQVETWYAIPVDGHVSLTAAGYWYLFVSLMIFRFLLLRWYFRMVVWYRFLWTVSRRLELRVNPLHPDGAGGLAFLSTSALAFQPVLLAHGFALAGIIGTKIWHEGATLPQFEMEIVAWIVFTLLLVLTPLFFFVPQLATAKRTGLREYGLVGSRYVAEFRRKWIEGQSAKGEALVGSPDI